MNNVVVHLVHFSSVNQSGPDTSSVKKEMSNTFLVLQARKLRPREVREGFQG